MNSTICGSCNYPYMGELCGNPACRSNASAEQLAKWDAEAELRRASEREREYLRSVRGW